MTERAGWITEHPTSGTPVHVVTREWFDELAGQLARERYVQYPYEDGDTIVIGPQCFVTSDGSVLSWRGQNYVQQQAIQQLPETTR